MVKFPTKLEEFLPPQAMSKVLDLLSQPQLTSAVKETLQKVGIRDATQLDKFRMHGAKPAVGSNQSSIASRTKPG